MSPTLLSLCMIVKNEEHFLRKCLNAAAGFVDEIVILDTGSTDLSKDIAFEFTDKVYDFEWCDDFAKARNASLAKAKGDWILVLDADEVIADHDFIHIRQTIKNTKYDAFFLVQYNYTNEILSKDWEPVGVPTSYSQDYLGFQRNPIGRLFRNRDDIRYQGKVHEVIDHSIEHLSVGSLDIPIHHDMESDPSKPREARQLNYLRLMEEALATAPDGRLYSNAATVCMYYKQDFPKAIDYLEHAIELGYRVDESKESLGEALYRAGNFDRARVHYQGLMDSGYTTFNLLNNLANLYVRAENYSRAVELLERAMEEYSPNEQIHTQLKHNIEHLKGKLS